MFFPRRTKYIFGKDKIKKEGIKNVDAILAFPGNPKIPINTVHIFMCDVLHHVANREAWLKTLSGEVKKGSKLSIIEFKPGKLPEGPPDEIKIPAEQIILMVKEAGFRLLKRDGDLLPYQTYFLFEKL